MSPHVYPCPTRWGDMDAQGHINNAAYVDYLQEARVHFLLTGPPEGRDLLDSGVLVVSHQVEYLRPVASATVRWLINLWVDAVGGSRFAIGYDVFDGDDLAARARTGLVPFDLAGNALRRLTAAEREMLTRHLAPAEPLAIRRRRPGRPVRIITSRSGCAGPIWTPTATSTTSSTTTTSRRPGSR